MQPSALAWMTRADDRLLRLLPHVEPHLPRLRAAIRRHDEVALWPLLRSPATTREGVEAVLLGRLPTCLDSWFELMLVLRDALDGAWETLTEALDPGKLIDETRGQLAHRVDADALDSFAMGLRVSVSTARWAIGREQLLEARLAAPGVDGMGIVRLTVLRDVATAAVLLGADAPASPPQDEAIGHLCGISKDLAVAHGAVLRTLGGKAPESGRGAPPPVDVTPAEHDWLAVSGRAFHRLLTAEGS